MNNTTRFNQQHGAFAQDQVRHQGITDDHFEELYTVNPAFGALHQVAELNASHDQRGFFISPETDMAYAGFQRSWGATDLIVRARSKFNMPGIHFSDSFFLQEEGVFIEEPGLMKHSPTPRDAYEFVTPEDVEEIFQNAVSDEEYKFSLTLNVDHFLKSISDRVISTSENANEQTVTILPSERMNSAGHVVGILNFEPATRFSDEFHFINMGINGEGRSLIVDNTYVEIGEEDLGQPFMFRFKGEYPAQELGGDIAPFCEIITRYEPGTRVAYQSFPSGQVIPEVYGQFSAYPQALGHGTYSLVTQSSDVLLVTPFQNRRSLNTMPMLTFQLSVLERVLEAFADFEHITIYAKEGRFAPVYIRGLHDENGESFGPATYDLEALMSPISPFTRGKILEV